MRRGLPHDCLSRQLIKIVLMFHKVYLNATQHYHCNHTHSKLYILYVSFRLHKSRYAEIGILELRIRILLLIVVAYSNRNKISIRL